MSDWYEDDETGKGWRSQPGLAGVVGIVVGNLNVSSLIVSDAAE